MGKDDSILILKFKTNKINKFIYIVLHVQAIENFMDIDWIKWYLSNRNMALWNFTKTFKKALKISQKMYKKCNGTEHGIKFLDTRFKFKDFDGKIIDSPLVESPKNIKKFIHFRTKYPEVWATFIIDSNVCEIKNLNKISIYNNLPN